MATTTTGTFTPFSGPARTLLSSTARPSTFAEIPRISLSSPSTTLIPQLLDACTRVGFFYVCDHGVPQAVIDDVFACTESFFALEPEVKGEIHFKKSGILRGWRPVGETRGDGQVEKPDLIEVFDCGYEVGLDPLWKGEGEREGAEIWSPQNPMHGPNSWPTVPGFKPRVARYYGEMLQLSRRLVRLFAQALDLPPDYFDSMVTHPGAMLDLLHYPPQPASDPSATGLRAHTDFECFTILCQGAQPGLQVLNLDGEWIEGPPVLGTFVVNIGDMLARWSNDRFLSTVHRVVNRTGQERYSIPFFFGPNYDAVVEPLKSCCVEEGDEKRYEPVLAGDYVWRRLAASRLTEEEKKGKFAKTTVKIG